MRCNISEGALFEVVGEDDGLLLLLLLFILILLFCPSSSLVLLVWPSTNIIPSRDGMLIGAI